MSNSTFLTTLSYLFLVKKIWRVESNIQNVQTLWGQGESTIGSGMLS
jgi:hypothetical protein